MHVKNKHKKKYNLDLLTNEFPKLLPYIKKIHQNKTIDFSNPKAVKTLNQALLKTHYNINYWDFSDDNLCPPIPGRVDYIHHLADLIDGEKNIKILDIGTGATLIYPLLGISEYNWKFIVSDINIDTLKNVKKLVSQNKLKDKIEIRVQKSTQNILKGIIKPNEKITVSMCNPPFYKSEEEAKAVNQKKLKGLKIEKKQRNFSGISNELWYPGGEKAFLHNYLYESTYFKEQFIWFTSLVSKKENIKSMQKSLMKLGAKRVKIIPMEQGNKISRIVAWSFIE